MIGNLNGCLNSSNNALDPSFAQEQKDNFVQQTQHLNNLFIETIEIIKSNIIFWIEFPCI